MHSHTVAGWARHAASTLEAAGFAHDDARRDVGTIVRGTLGWDQGEWIVRQHDALAAEDAERLTALVERRVRHEPVAYLLGGREFYGRMFTVTRDVLIPRPETELLIDAAADVMTRVGGHAGAPEIMDVGTGSGCLAITLALEHPDARVTATDISRAALDVAAQNAARHGVNDRVTFVHAPLTAGVESQIDVLISNPPYVPFGDLRALAPDVAEYEPHTALFGGLDGLDVIRALTPAAARALRPGGWWLLEIGAGQADLVCAVIEATPGLRWLRTIPDLAGIPRTVVAQRTDLSI